MKSLSVSSKHLMILIVFAIPFAFLFYLFFSEQKSKLNTLEKQRSKITSVKKKTKFIDQLLSQRLTGSLTPDQKNRIDVQIKKETQAYEKMLVDSNLIFSSNFYGYYMTQLSLVHMPELYADLVVLNQMIEANSPEIKSLRAKIDEKLKVISELSAQALAVKERTGVDKKRQIASVRTYLDQTFSYLNQLSYVNTTTVKKSFLAETNVLSSFWLQSLDEIAGDISRKMELEKNENIKYSIIFVLMLLVTITMTMNIFYDMSQRIKKLTHLTRYTDTRQLSIQTTDFGYDEIGQLAQSFNTMALSLRDSFNKIEFANNAKSLFLANVSHEIRTPISGIIGMARFMDETPLNSEQKNYLNIIKKSSDMLLILINDLLDLAKIESGKMTIEKVPFCLSDLLKDVYDCFHHQAEQKGIRLVLNSSVLEQQMYVGDPYKIKQIVFNLTSNAIKFTSHGQVEIFCEENQNEVRLAVRDQGIGIPEEKLSALFQDFVQVDASTKRKFGGTGLGLSLSKKLAKLMSGDLTVVSREGVGSEFLIELTLEKSNEVRASQHLPPRIEKAHHAGLDLKPLKILVAEDNAVNQLIIKKYLQKWSYESYFVENGQQAVNEIQNTSDYDLILMDCQMPEMDGFEATRLIKLQYPNLKVIALTANATSDDQKKCLEAGMDDFISKPIDPELLHRMISGVQQ